MKILKDKIDYSISLLKKAEPLALRYNSEGFYLCFSGGKDSQALYHIAKLAGVKFVAHMNLTSVDPPQVLKFIRKHYPDVILHRPSESIYKMIPKHKCLPTRMIRWCCSLLKEQSGAGNVALIGIRKSESYKRSKRQELEISGHKFSGNFDQFSEHQETEITCIKGKDKIMVSPILDWTDTDVWEFLNSNNIPHCELYDMGYNRIGCIMCPMSSKKNAIRDREMFPGIEKAYKKAISNLLKVHPNYAKKLNGNVDLIFDWWCSKLNMDEYIAKNITQLKLQFKSEENRESITH